MRLTKQLLMSTFLLLLVVLFLVGCEGGNANTFQGTTSPTQDIIPIPARDTAQPILPPTSIATARGEFGNLEFTLSLPKARFAQGEQFGITSTVRNVSSEPVSTNFRLGQLMILIWYRDGQEVDRISTPTAGYGATTFAPGEIRTETYQDTTRSAGTYTIVGILDNAIGGLPTPEQEQRRRTPPLTITFE